MCKKGSKLNTVEKFEIYKSQIKENLNKTNHILNEKLQIKSHFNFKALWG